MAYELTALSQSMPDFDVISRTASFVHGLLVSGNGESIAIRFDHEMPQDPCDWLDVPTTWWTIALAGHPAEFPAMVNRYHDPGDADPIDRLWHNTIMPWRVDPDHLLATVIIAVAIAILGEGYIDDQQVRLFPDQEPSWALDPWFSVATPIETGADPQRALGRIGLRSETAPTAGDPGPSGHARASSAQPPNSGPVSRLSTWLYRVLLTGAAGQIEIGEQPAHRFKQGSGVTTWSIRRDNQSTFQALVAPSPTESHPGQDAAWGVTIAISESMEPVDRLVAALILTSVALIGDGAVADDECLIFPAVFTRPGQFGTKPVFDGDWPVAEALSYLGVIGNTIAWTYGDNEEWRNSASAEALRDQFRHVDAERKRRVQEAPSSQSVRPVDALPPARSGPLQLLADALDRLLAWLTRR